MKIRVLAAGAGLALVLAGCGGGSTPAAAPTPAAPEPRELTVFAAASLNETFTELAKQFETDNPGVTVKFNFAGSSDLAQQIVNGAPADVFASASDATMKTVTDAGRSAAAADDLRDERPGDRDCARQPQGHHRPSPTSRSPTSRSSCARPQVPCGAAAEKIEKSTGVTLSPVSEEPDVKSTLGKVTSGDADAGLVYVTDVPAAGAGVRGRHVPGGSQATTNYPIASGHGGAAGRAGRGVPGTGDRRGRAEGARGGGLRRPHDAGTGGGRRSRYGRGGPTTTRPVSACPGCCGSRPASRSR